MIEVNQVHFSYDSTKILHDFNLIESEKIIVGLWGRNGTGKTTFMKLLAGNLKPDQGEIKIQGLILITIIKQIIIYVICKKIIHSVRFGR